MTEYQEYLFQQYVELMEEDNSNLSKIDLLYQNPEFPFSMLSQEQKYIDDFAMVTSTYIKSSITKEELLELYFSTDKESTRTEIKFLISLEEKDVG